MQMVSSELHWYSGKTGTLFATINPSAANATNNLEGNIYKQINASNKRISEEMGNVLNDLSEEYNKYIPSHGNIDLFIINNWHEEILIVAGSKKNLLMNCFCRCWLFFLLMK